MHAGQAIAAAKSYPSGLVQLDYTLRTHAEAPASF
jgi:hypothetical protein